MPGKKNFLTRTIGLLIKPEFHQPTAYALAATLCLVATNATAQQPQADQNTENWALEEIVVTARKREENLQDAPIAISAFSGDGLRHRGVTNLGQIENFAPNLTFQNNPSFGGASSAAAIYIRGIGQKEFLPTVDPGVGIYVDGIYVARSVGAILDLVEVERVEVLRGPQGTLFGRNTIGGAISITTKKPDDKLAGSLSTTFGSDQRLDVKASANVPLSDNLFSRFTVAAFNRDGYVTRPADGLKLGDDDTISGRAAFLWNASETVDVELAVDFTKDREAGPAVRLLGINYAGPVDPETPPMATIHNVIASAMANGTPPPLSPPCIIPPGGTTGTNINLAVPGCYDDRYITNGNTNLGTARSYSDTDLFSAAVNLSWEINDNLTFRSLTGFRDLDSSFGRDGDGSPFRISQFEDTLEQQQFTQEFQLLGTALDSRLNWILGLYYFEEDGNNVNTLDFTVSNFISGGQFDNRSTAIFAQASYDLTDKFSATLGVRFTDDSKKFLPDQIILNNHFAGSGDPLLDAPFLQAGTRILPFVEKEVTAEEVTPMVNLQYRISDELMLYTSYSEGFKSGGFSQRVFPPVVAGFTAPAGTPDLDLIPSFESEFVESVELGIKYASSNGKLRINAAIFNTDYDDFQIQVFTSVAPVTKNAASVQVRGGELEVSWAPAEGWLLETSVGTVDAEYKELNEAETLISRSNDLERVPDLTLSASVSRTITLNNGSSLALRLDWSHRAEQFMDTFNTPQIAQDDYQLVNANITWLSPDDRFSVALGGTNLTDEQYLVSGILGDAFQSYEGVFAREREYYLNLNYKLGSI